MREWLEKKLGTYRKGILKRTLQGAITGSGAPLGWAVIQAIRGVDVSSDIAQRPVLYLYMLIGTMAVFAAFGFYMGRHENNMRQLSLRDALTRLYNLRYFRERLVAEIIESERRDTPLSLIFFDLDHFKKVNDTHGHAAGDIVLVAIAENVGNVLRRNELFARTGGEEFAILLPTTSLEQAHQLAERVLTSVRQLSIPIHREKTLKVTMSLGVVELMDEEEAPHFAERADAAMYLAKANGRNRVEVDDGSDTKTDTSPALAQT